MGILHRRSRVFARALKSAVVFTAVAISVTSLQVTPASAAQAAASIEQCRNGEATAPTNCDHVGGADGWVKGNAGGENAHFIEGHSIPYRAVLTDLPVGTPVQLDIGYDIKHSGGHALDFITHYDRLQPHTAFGHPAETFNPIVGTSAPNSFTTFPIDPPSSTSPCASPVAGQPTTRFNSLPAAKRLMTLYGGTLTDFSYVSQGCLTDAQAETIFRVKFTPSSSSAVLAWGGHIARAQDWGEGNSASGVSGSPYHMRLKDWDCANSPGCEAFGDLGNQDRSLKTDAIIPTPCPAGGDITISRTIDAGVPRPASFTYQVRGPDSFTDADVVDTVTITFRPGNPSTKSAVAETPSGAIGQYKIIETSRPPNHTPLPDQFVNINPDTRPACAAQVGLSGGFDRPAVARVIKTEEPTAGNRRNALGKWTFTLIGPDNNPNGDTVLTGGETTRTKQTNTNGANHTLRFGNLAPGDYRICEKFFRGWKSNMGKGLPSGEGSNPRLVILPTGDRCVDFTVETGQTKTFRVNNACPTGRRAPGT